MQRLNKYYWSMLLCLCMGCIFAACSSDDEDPVASGSMITIADADKDIQLDYEESWQSFSFTSRAAWTAAVEGEAKWIKLSTTSGSGGSSQKIGFDVEMNTTKESRSAVIAITCNKEVAKVNVTQAASDREVISKADIPNYEMFYFPGDPSYASREEDMFNSDSKYNWFHYKQSPHFFVFWDSRFGKDPNGADVPEWARVNIDDLLEKAEIFFDTNINQIKMADIGKGKSYLDQYKMQIWLIYDDGWVATGSGYGDKIGALWVTPSTCKPVGSVIAHEIGHSFQYQVYADKLLQGAPNDYTTGFRYGWGGTGGCGYWEQCAQWQSMRDYPEQQFGQDFNPWLVNYHRHFCHEWMRYQSYWLQSYWVQLHGIDVFGSIWKNSYAPEDPIMTYVRLYCGGDYNKFWEEYYDYASRMVTYDLDHVREYRDGYWGLSSNYKTSLFSIGDMEYQVAYNSVPETSGFNIIRLNVPQGGGRVSVDFKALAPGSALAPGDAGQYLKGDNEAVGGTVTKYNSNSGNTDADFRYGFVAVVDGKPQYSEPAHNAEGTASYNVPAAAEDLYLVIVPTPAKYNQHAWDNDDLTDETWPYSFKISGTDLFGNMAIDPDKALQSIDFSYDLKCDASLADYPQGAVNLNSNGDLAKLAQAFLLQPGEITAITKSISAGSKGEPTEGTIVFGLTQADNSISYEYTANVGFYISAEGNVGSWGNNDPIFVEYDKENFVLNYGHKPGCTEAGKKYVVKPTLVYTKDGVQYKATFTLNLQF